MTSAVHVGDYTHGFNDPQADEGIIHPSNRDRGAQLTGLLTKEDAKIHHVCIKTCATCTMPSGPLKLALGLCSM